MIVSVPARVAATALAVVFLVAAGAKLRRPEATAKELGELGLVWSAPLARLIPLVEVATAVALVAAPAWGGVAAFALLGAFTAVLIGVLRSGRAVSCACFGGISERPVSARTLGRNGLLLALASLAALG